MSNVLFRFMGIDVSMCWENVNENTNVIKIKNKPCAYSKNGSYYILAFVVMCRFLTGGLLTCGHMSIISDGWPSKLFILLLSWDCSCDFIAGKVGNF